MAQRIFSTEDGNLNVRPITTSKQRSFIDVDPSFMSHQVTGVYQLMDANAVKQSIKNIVLTDPGERPFDQYLGGGVNSFLFENFGDTDQFDLRDRIASVISNYEPRVRLRTIDVEPRLNNNSLDITINFSIINNLDVTETLLISLTGNR